MRRSVPASLEAEGLREVVCSFVSQGLEVHGGRGKMGLFLKVRVNRNFSWRGDTVTKQAGTMYEVTESSILRSTRTDIIGKQPRCTCKPLYTPQSLMKVIVRMISRISVTISTICLHGMKRHT